MKVIILLVLLTSSLYANKADNLYLYTEIYGPQEGLISPNLEFTLLRTESEDFGDGSLRLRAAMRFSGLSFFTIYPSYLCGIHFITGFEHKVDLGVGIMYQELSENYVFKTGTSLSFNLGYRHKVGESWFVGFAINPTFGKENKPFYPVSMKIGFSIF